VAIRIDHFLMPARQALASSDMQHAAG
jgi:hypothetical protein